jgi:hypothetical protein
LLPLRRGAAPAFGGAGADKITFNVGQAAEYGQHQAPSAGAGVRPRLGDEAKFRLGVHDALDKNKPRKRRRDSMERWAF